MVNIRYSGRVDSIEITESSVSRGQVMKINLFILSRVSLHFGTLIAGLS